MKKLFAVLLCLGLAGCATTGSNLNNISVGMTKADVIKTLGSPSSVSAINGVEYLKYEDHSFGTNYRRAQEEQRGFYSPTPTYYVRLVNGKVDSYGNVGDFDSTKNPALDINANVNGGEK